MKAVISTGSKQHIVEKGDKLNVEFLGDKKKTIEFEPLMLIDEKNVRVGQPHVKGASVRAKVIDKTREAKVTSIRYKAKKRVHKRKGHKQVKSVIEITSVSDK